MAEDGKRDAENSLDFDLNSSSDRVVELPSADEVFRNFEGMVAVKGTPSPDASIDAASAVGFSTSVCHLFWTVPLALLIGYPLWFAARLGWCGYGGCWGTDANSQQTEYGSGVVLAILCALLVFAAILIPPWFRPWWVRLIVAVVVAVAVSYIFGWGRAPSVIPFLPTIPFGGIQF